MRLPPLRERAGDIPLLAAFFLNQSAALTADGMRRTLSESANERLLAHPWPGNLRELRHEMQRASVLAGESRVIEGDDLSFARRPASSPSSESGATLAEGEGREPGAPGGGSRSRPSPQQSDQSSGSTRPVAAGPDQEARSLGLELANARRRLERRGASASGHSVEAPLGVAEVVASFSSALPLLGGTRGPWRDLVEFP